jgi:hypothetical protein
VIITNPGFGYTQFATIRIGTSAGTGIGATANVELASSALTVTSFSLVGAAVSSNSSGFGLGLAATNVGNSLTSNTANIAIAKIIKNPLHYYWLNSTGNAIVSGGAVQSTNFVPASLLETSIFLFPLHNAGLDNSELFSHVYLSGSDYIYQLFNFGFTGTNYAPTTFSLQPFEYLGAYKIGNFGGFGAAFDSNDYLNVFYHDIENSITESWVQAVQISYVVDMTLCQADITQTEAREKRTYIIVLQAVPGGTVINIYICNAATNTTAQNFNPSPVQIFVSRQNATKLAAAYINHYRGEYFTRDGETYSWIKSDTNIAVGYQDGTIELYGNATHYTVDGGIVLVSSWNPNGYAITALDAICDWQFPNIKYLFAGTSNGQIYCYQADGDPLKTYIQTQLLINQSPKLLNTLTLPSLFGYIISVQNFIAGVVMASTSTNMLVFIRIEDLKVIGYISVPGAIISMTSTINPENISTTIPIDTPVACVTVDNGISVRAYEYYSTSIQNYEMGLNYANIAGAYQTVTTDGTVVGAPMTSIVDISTSDTFTIIVDSSNPAI